MSDSIVKVLITGDARGLGKAVESANSELDKTGHKAGITGGQMLAMSGVSVAAVGEISQHLIHMGDDFELARTRAQTALKNTGDSSTNLDSEINTLTDSSISLANTTKTDVAGAFATLVTGLGSNARAMHAWTEVTDIAAAKGMTLGDSAMLVTKTLEGNTKAAKSLGIQLPFTAATVNKLQKEQQNLFLAETNLKTVEKEIADGQIPHAQAAGALKTAMDKVALAQANVTLTSQEIKKNEDILAGKFKGEYAAAAETNAGKLNKLKNEAHNLEITLGVGLSSAEVHGLAAMDRLTTGIANDINKYAVPAVDKLTNKIAGFLQSLAGASPGSAIANLLGLGGNPNGTPGAAQRDRTRDNLNHQGAGTGNIPNPTKGHGNGVPHTSVTVNVQGADPATVVRAIQQYARRNGVQ